MRFVRGFGQFWYDFIIGDDWKIAASMAMVLLIGAVIVATTQIVVTPFVISLGVAQIAAFVVAIVVDTRRAVPHG